MAFASNVHVFPGGRVDPSDADPNLIARSVVSPGDAALGLGGDLDDALAIATWIAAIRELFEEAGVLLAEAADGADISDRSVAVARSALVSGDATFGSIVRDLDLRLRMDLLVPFSRWVTPAAYPRRFDARFFVAALPDGVEATFEGGEVAAHAWLRPTDALAAMAGQGRTMWLPTSTTLQQLEYAGSVEEIGERLAPGPLGPIITEVLSPEVTRIVMPAGGGIAGQPVCAYLVGRRRLVLIDPGDPTGTALDEVLRLADGRGGAIEAVALTHVDPDHAAGAEAVAESLDIPVLTGPGGGRPLPYAVHELADLERIAAGDVSLRAVHTPGPRADHLAFIVGDGAAVVSGDLDGVRGARSIPGPADVIAWAVSNDRLRTLVPGARQLGGHPSADR